MVGSSLLRFAPCCDLRARGHLAAVYGREAGDDEGGVDEGPGVAEEGPEPVAVEVEEELDGEDDGEGEVEGVEGAAGRGARPVGSLQLVDVLRFGDVAREVLRAAASVHQREWARARGAEEHR